MNLLNALKWRYAVKRMNGEKIPVEKLNEIMEAIQLAPSSLGFTPYTLILVEDQEIKEKLSPACFNQPQIKESSALVVFAAWKNYSEAQVDEYIKLIANTRNVEVESLEGFAGMIKNKINNTSQENLFTWAAKQAYLALGFGLAAAAVAEVDSTPMEGFNPAGVDEVLGLSEKGLASVAILALGYRDAASDYLVQAKKVRRPIEELVIKH
jgi:nitroreductase